MKRILVLNLGSTSFKFKLYEMGAEERLLAAGGVESVGGEGAYSVRAGGAAEEGACGCKTHLGALALSIWRRWPSPPLPTRSWATSACTRRFWAGWTR